MKHCKSLALAVTFLTLSAVSAFAQNGNGGPTGAHYNLNIIGVPKDKTAAMDGANGHVIFVKLWGNSKINLCDADACASGNFQVLDANGTDNDGASFALPSPDPDADGTTDYSVFARALGQPGNSADMTTCATGAGDDGVFGTADDEIVCSEIILTLDSTTRPNRFQNVSKWLLYVYADIDGDGVVERVPLFGDSLQDFYWNYDNSGLKLAQLRFYPCSSTVPDADNSGGITTDNCNYTGNGN